MYGKRQKGRLPNSYNPAKDFGEKVPPGGSNCAKCPYLAKNKTDCEQKDFIFWNGGPVIPGKINEYCCSAFPAVK